MKKICKNCQTQFENRASEYCSVDCTLEGLDKNVAEFTSDILASDLSSKN